MQAKDIEFGFECCLYRITFYTRSCWILANAEVLRTHYLLTIVIALRDVVYFKQLDYHPLVSNRAIYRRIEIKSFDILLNNSTL